MSLVEDLRTIKQRREGPGLRITRDRANAYLKEAVRDHAGLIYFNSEDLNDGNRLIGARIEAKINPTEEAELVEITNNQDSPSGPRTFRGFSLTEYQFSKSGILLKRNVIRDELWEFVGIEKGYWEVVETNEINMLTDFINNPVENSEKVLKIWSSGRVN